MGNPYNTNVIVEDIQDGIRIEYFGVYNSGTTKNVEFINFIYRTHMKQGQRKGLMQERDLNQKLSRRKLAMTIVY